MYILLVPNVWDDFFHLVQHQKKYKTQEWKKNELNRLKANGTHISAPAFLQIFIALQFMKPIELKAKVQKC